MSGVAGDIEKGRIRVQRRWRTEARTSAKAGTGLGIPGGPAKAEGTRPTQMVGDEDEPTEEAQQDRGGAGDGSRRPLALGLHPQMGADFLKGNLHLPALQVGGEEGLGAPVGVGAQQGPGLLLPGRVAQEPPAQGDGGLARVVPEGGAGGGLEMPLGAVGPALGQGGPDRGRVGQDRLQGGLAGRRRIMEDGIQAQAGQEGDGWLQALAGGQQLQADPAQSLGLDEVAVGRADRVPVHPQGLDFLPPAPFQGLVDSQQERSRRHQVPDQLSGSTRLTARDDQEARLRTW